MECEWLPGFYDEPDWNNYALFEEQLYGVFKQIYLDLPLFFNEVNVRYRFHPIVNNKEEIFYHLTCKDYECEGERCPDPNRIVRIRWTRAFIENYLCNNECCSSKPLYWIKKNKNKLRHKIFFGNFLVILEERNEYFLLVTGFYIEEEYYKRGLIEEYSKCI